MKSPSPTSTTVKHVALDVHAETLAVGIAEGIEAVRIYGTVPATTHAFDRLHAKLSADGSEVRYVYEAGPTGFWLSRHLAAKGISVGVVSPAQVPKKAGDRIKTDHRDASHLARLFRAGELAFIHVPDETDEAMRDLVRTRLRAVEDLRTCRQRIQGFLLRYGRRYDGKSRWTAGHLNYLSIQKFAHPGQQIAFEELLRAVQDPIGRIERLTAAIHAQLPGWRRRPLVEALMCLRGFSTLHAVTWVAEIGDFTRFAKPTGLMSFIGIVPSESSSGQKRRQGAITRTGNEGCRRAVIEAAWQYRLPARVTPHIRKRQHGQPKAVVEIAWKAQVRLCARFQDLLRNRKKSVVAVTAVARELVGFIWAIAMQVEGKTPPAQVQEILTEALKEENPQTEAPEAAQPRRTYQLDPDKFFPDAEEED
jgi:transposase